MKQITRIVHQHRKLLYILFGISFVASTGCKKDNSAIQEDNVISSNSSNSSNATNASSYSDEVIDKWMTIQLRLMKDAIGLPNIGFSRFYAYSGIAALESISPGMPKNQTLTGKWNG